MVAIINSFVSSFFLYSENLSWSCSGKPFNMFSSYLARISLVSFNGYLANSLRHLWQNGAETNKEFPQLLHFFILIKFKLLLLFKCINNILYKQ